MKKKIASVLALAMAFSALAGCGSSADTQTASGTENADGQVTISFFDKNSGTRTFTDPVALELEARTGVTIDLISPTGDPGEKLALMLASQDYPDIVLMDRSSDIVNQYIEAGALVNLSDYMDLMPNVQEMYGDVLNKTRYTDGNNYYLSNWYGYDPDPMNGMICRYDIMVELVGQERADSSEPFTWSEFVDLLKQFKEKYPTINGRDSIALMIGEPGSGSINGEFLGLNGMYPMYVDDDGVHLSTQDPSFLTAIHQMNELYTEGLLDPEWTSNNEELRNQKLSGGYVFCYAGAYWDTWSGSTSLMASEGEDAEYLAYKVVADGLDPSEVTTTSRSSLGWDAIAITTNCQDIEAACKFIDYCASQEGQDLLLWGIEGQDWEYVDGVRTPIGDIVEQYQADSSNVVDQTGITKWTWFVKNSNHEDDDTTCRIWFNEKDRSATYAYNNLTDGYYDSAEFSNLQPAGSTTEALEYQKLMDIFDQAYPNMVNASSQAECDAVYEQMLADLENAGEADVEEYMTGIYSDRMELWGMEWINKR